MHLRIVSGDPAAPLDYHQHDITSTAQRSVDSARRYGEFCYLRGVV